MAFTQDLFTSRRNYPDGNLRIGDTDRLWYDSLTNTIRIGDGNPGGKIVSGASLGSTVYSGDTPPTTPESGWLWYDTVSGRLYVYETDIDSSQWVDASPNLTTYNLPIATSITLGGVKIGASISVAGDGTIDVIFPDNIVNNYGNANVIAYLTVNPQPGTYGDSNVAAYLPIYTGNVNAAYYFGDGGLLSNIAYNNYSNVNVDAWFSANISDSLYSNVNVTAYLGSLDNVAVGSSAGITNQGASAVAIGPTAGRINQSASAVAIGPLAGNDTQGASAVAIGNQAAGQNQGEYAVAIGQNAGDDTQGTNAVAIGQNAGQNTQGNNAIAIGHNAGLGYTHYQAANTIILNATGGIVDGVNGQTNSFYVAPIRTDSDNVAQALYYNTTTKEVTYAPVSAYSNVNVAAYLNTTSGYYGSFWDNTPVTQNANLAIVNTIPIANTYSNLGVSITNGDSITFSANGSYKLDYSLQFQNSDNKTNQVAVWLRKNGSDVADSSSYFSLPAQGEANGYICAVGPFIDTITSGDYYQLMWVGFDSHISLQGIPAKTGSSTVPPVPAAPSTIIMVTRV